MDYFNMSPQRMLSQSGSIILAENALIDEVSTINGSTGYILISYSVPDQNNQFQLTQIRLNIGRNTIIVDQSGQTLYLFELENGMRVDAEFSAAMTRSIPPQSNAYRIVVLSEQPSVNITTDRVADVDVTNGFLTTGNPYDMNDQMRFNISEETLILDQNGNQIPLSAIQLGQMVRVEHAIFQTLSIPPQSPAYLVEVL